MGVARDDLVLGTEALVDDSSDDGGCHFAGAYESDPVAHFYARKCIGPMSFKAFGIDDPALSF